jgi:hypothetical protein
MPSHVQNEQWGLGRILARADGARRGLRVACVSGGDGCAGRAPGAKTRRVEDREGNPCKGRTDVHLTSAMAELGSRMEKQTWDSGFCAFGHGGPGMVMDRCTIPDSWGACPSPSPLLPPGTCHLRIHDLHLPNDQQQPQ